MIQTYISSNNFNMSDDHFGNDARTQMMTQTFKSFTGNKGRTISCMFNDTTDFIVGFFI